VDYLSLDPGWVDHHALEHIESTQEHTIIELIPSPLGGAGLLPVASSPLSREDLVARYELPSHILHKKWYGIFAYPDTLERIELSVPQDAIVWIAGQAGSRRGEEIVLPWMPFLDFYALLGFSEAFVVRGEVSFSQAIQLQKPFLWDIYHDR